MKELWYDYFVNPMKGGVNMKELWYDYFVNPMKDIVKPLLMCVIVGAVFLSFLSFIPNVSADTKPLQPHVCGAAKADSSNSHLSNKLGHGNVVLPTSGNVACNGDCVKTGDYCYRCEGACPHNPGMVSQLIGTEKACLWNGIPRRACCDPWTTYCTVHCME